MGFAVRLRGMILLLLGLPVAAGAAGRPDFDRGFSYLKWGSAWRTDSPGEMKGLRELGADSVSFVPIWYQTSAGDTEIFPHRVLSPSMEDLRFAVREALRNGLRVILKPHVDIIDDPWSDRAGDRSSWLGLYRQFQLGYPMPRGGAPETGPSWFDRLFPSWRGEIAPPPDADRERWIRSWFDGYRDFITPFAELAAEENLDGFAVATELRRLHGEETEWRALIRHLRGRMKGSRVKLLYHANHDDFSRVAFWDAVDAIGISAYFPLSEEKNPPLSVLRAGWNRSLDQVESWFARVAPGKPVYFTEAGFTSLRGTAKAPWDFRLNTVEDEEEQARCLEASLLELPGRPWLKGVYFWRWTMRRNEPLFNYDYYTPHAKKAEQVIRRYWGGSR